MKNREPFIPLGYPYVDGDLAADGRTCRHCGRAAVLDPLGDDEPDAQFHHRTWEDDDDCRRLRWDQMSEQDRLRTMKEWEAGQSAIEDMCQELARRIEELFEWAFEEDEADG